MGQIAQASLAVAIGQIETASGSVTITRIDGTTVPGSQGTPIYQGDMVETAKGGKTGIIFVDKTTFALGEGGQMRMDELVYNPQTKSGSLGMSMLKGAFVMVTGEIAPSSTDAVTIRTPVATIGVRGTKVAGSIDTYGALDMALLPDPLGRPSAVVVSNGAGTQFLTDSNTGIQISSYNEAPNAPQPIGAFQPNSPLGAVLSFLDDVIGGDQMSLIAQTAGTQNETRDAIVRALAPESAAAASSNGNTNASGSDTPAVKVTDYEGDLKTALAIDSQTKLTDPLANSDDGTTVVIRTATPVAPDRTTDPIQIPVVTPPPEPEPTKGLFITGTPGADYLTGSMYGDTIYGRGGIDTISAGAGDDYIRTIGLPAGSVIDGGGGDDTLAILLKNGVQTLSGAITYAAHIDLIVGGITGTADVLLTSGIIGPSVAIGTEGTTTQNVTIRGASGGGGLTLEGAGFLGSDFASGTDGSDNIFMGAGNDTISGGDGLDTLSGGDGNDALYGGDNDDILYGGAGNDLLDGNYGEDVLSGGDGNDVLILDAGADKAYGNNGNDVFVYIDMMTSNDDTVDGGAGTDTLRLMSDAGDLSSTGTNLFNSIEVLELNLAGSLNTTLPGLSTPLLIKTTAAFAAGTGNAYLDASSSTGDITVDWSLMRADFTNVKTGSGDDVIKIGNAGVANTVGATTNDGNDKIDISAHTGAGFVDSGNGNDTVTGGSGDDVIFAGDGNDSLVGGNGADYFAVGTGSDTVMAGAGSDVVTMTAAETDGSDILNGGSGTELDQIQLANSGTFDFSTGQMVNFEHLYFTDPFAASRNLILGSGVSSNTGSILIEIAGPNAGDMTVNASAIGGGTAIKIGDLYWNGNDSIQGGSANDTLNGGAGSDTLVGNGGIDSLSGGTGDDLYIVDSSDIVDEGAGEGYDAVHSSTSYTLGANLEVLSLTGTGNTNGVGNVENNIIAGNSGNNILRGDDGNDYMSGDAGNDILSGGTGTDTMWGNTGNDAYYVDDAGDLVWEFAGEGTDTIHASTSFTIAANVEVLSLTGAANIDATGSSSNERLYGNSGDNLLLGLGGNDTLVGGAGNDTFDGGTGNDQMSGGAGDDLYLVDSPTDTVTELVGEGSDTIEAAVSYTLVANIEVLSLVGGGNINGTGLATDDEIYGNSGNNALLGLAGDDRLQGLDGNDTLDGGTGQDTMSGGLGDDLYIVDNVLDFVLEDPGAGIDTIQSSISFGLTTDVEVLSLTGSGNINGTGTVNDDTIIGNSGNNSLFGFLGDDVLSGGGGNDTLDGDAGTDTMVGGVGNDLYIVDVAGDVAEENAGGGTDTVQAWASYTIGTSIEVLSLMGASDLVGTGDGDADTLIGNSGHNALYGLGGTDVLNGGAGNDTLDGGAGVDGLIGGLGDDLFIVDNAGDSTGENVGEGTDTVEASVSYALAANIEILSLTGGANINGSGNADNNTIFGNTGDNVLSGAAGNDYLEGDAGNDTLDGGTGTDTLSGGTGDDVYVVDSLTDQIYESLGEGIDTIKAAISYTLASNVEVLSLTGAGNINGAGTSYGDTLIGNTGNNLLFGDSNDDALIGGAGNDTLDGGTGDDVLSGGLGNDLYVIDSGGDIIFEAAGEGTDTVQTALSYTLGSNLEVLSIIGGDTVVAWGNGGNNTLYGNATNSTYFGDAGNDLIVGGSGNETLEGGAGSDTMSGGAGNDYYIINDSTDLVVEASGNGIDTIFSVVNYTMTANTEVLYLGGTGSINGMGSATADTIIGNSGDNLISGYVGADVLSGAAGNDTIDGGSFSDTMYGGLGDDMYIVDDMGDQAIELGAEGTDTVQSAVHFTLMGTNIEVLSLTGSANVVGVGSNNADTIIGNSGNNALTGNDGNDVLSGGAGLDTIYGGNGADTIDGGIGNDVISGGAGIDVMSGGAGNDTFAINFSEITGTPDHILDFTSGQDKLSFSGTGLTTGTLGVLNFQNDSGNLFTGQAINVLPTFIISTWDGSTHGTDKYLWYDADGIGGSAGYMVAKLDPATTMTNTDITIAS